MDTRVFDNLRKMHVSIHTLEQGPNKKVTVHSYNPTCRRIRLSAGRIDQIVIGAARIRRFVVIGDIRRTSRNAWIGDWIIAADWIWRITGGICGGSTGVKAGPDSLPQPVNLIICRSSIQLDHIFAA